MPKKYTIHLPDDAEDGEAPVWVDDQYVSTDIATQAELDDHAALPDVHHNRVTLGWANDDEMATLLVQELTILLKAHVHNGTYGNGGQFSLTNLLSGLATSGQVPVADGAGGIAWGGSGGVDIDARRLIWMGW